MVIPSRARFLKRTISGFAEFVDIGCFDQGRQLERGLQIESKPSPSLRKLPYSEAIRHGMTRPGTVWLVKQMAQCRSV